MALPQKHCKTRANQRKSLQITPPKKHRTKMTLSRNRPPLNPNPPQPCRPKKQNKRQIFNVDTFNPHTSLEVRARSPLILFSCCLPFFQSAYAYAYAVRVRKRLGRGVIFWEAIITTQRYFGPPSLFIFLNFSLFNFLI